VLIHFFHQHSAVHLSSTVNPCHDSPPAQPKKQIWVSSVTHLFCSAQTGCWFSNCPLEPNFLCFAQLTCLLINLMVKCTITVLKCRCIKYVEICISDMYSVMFSLTYKDQQKKNDQNNRDVKRKLNGSLDNWDNLCCLCYSHILFSQLALTHTPDCL